MSRIGAAPRAAVSVSKARAEASRRNGAKSRGPRTAEGKARAAQNALRHGFRAEQHVVLPDEDAAEFAALEAAMVAELAPVGALQILLSQRIAVAAWRLARADRMEAEVLQEQGHGSVSAGLALIRDGNGTRSFETLLRYRGAAMAEFWRALRTLKALQAEQAISTDPVLATRLPGATAPAPLARQPNGPDLRAENRLSYLVPDQPVIGHTLHEPAAPWTPESTGGDFGENFGGGVRDAP